MRCDGVEAFDAELTWRSDVVFVQADFKMQMGISDAGTSRECECVAFAESGVRLDGNVVTLGGVLLLLDLVFYGRCEAALVGEYPGLAAFAFEEHDFTITEW